MLTLDQAIQNLDQKGFLNLEIPKGIDLVEEINKLRKEKTR